MKDERNCEIFKVEVIKMKKSALVAKVIAQAPVIDKSVVTLVACLVTKLAEKKVSKALQESFGGFCQHRHLL